MPRGSTDPVTVASEMQGADSPTDSRPEGMSDEEWEAASPDEKPTQKPMFGSAEPPDIDGPLEFHAQLLRVSDTSGSQGDAISAQFETPWTEIKNIADRYKKSLELRFGAVTVMGASVKSQASNTDADGAVRLKVVFAIPESQKKAASDLFMLTGKGGPLSIEPNQLSLDALLTTRAEDDENPIGTFEDVADEEPVPVG